MSLLSEYKNCIVIIIITIILGYFLGLSVSTVVDYRLKDAIIKFPRQKNNIVVRLDNEQIETFSNNKKTKSKTRSKTKSKGKLNKKKPRKSKLRESSIEKFQNYNCIPNNLEKYNHKVKPTIADSPFKAWNNFNKDLKIEDPNIKIYSKNYKDNRKANEDNLYKAANEEDTDQQFQNLTIKSSRREKLKSKNKTN